MKPKEYSNLLRSHALRHWGTLVQLAGKAAYLPDNDRPIVVQNLTEKQINAIPRDKYAVFLLALSSKVAIPYKDEKGRMHLAPPKSPLRKGIHVDHLRPVQSDTGRSPKPNAVHDDGTKEYTAIIAMTNQIKKNAEKSIIIIANSSATIV